jgi:hypothetical protein
VAWKKKKLLLASGLCLRFIRWENGSRINGLHRNLSGSRSREKNARQNLNIEIGCKSFKSTENFKYCGTTLTNKYLCSYRNL